jgi:hypothetical protein
VGTFNILSTKVPSGLMYNREFGHFCTMPHLVLSRMIEWIVADTLALDRDKLHTDKFITKIRRDRGFSGLLCSECW